MSEVIDKEQSHKAVNILKQKYSNFVQQLKKKEIQNKKEETEDAGNVLLSNDDDDDVKQEPTNKPQNDTNPDYAYALKLQKKYMSMSDEKLAMELQIEETSMRQNANVSFMALIGQRLMNVMGVQASDINIFSWQRLPIKVLKSNDVNLLHKSEENKTCAICMADCKKRDKTRQ
eukprot:UN06497